MAALPITAKFAAGEYADTKSSHSWEDIEEEVKPELTSLSIELSHGIITTSTAAERLVEILRATLIQHGIILEKTTSHNTHHRRRGIEVLTENLRSTKNRLRKEFKTNRQEFLRSVRVHNRAMRDLQNWKSARSNRKQEGAFWRDRWKFAKSVCQESTPDEPPLFSCNTAFSHFADIFSKRNNCDFGSNCLPTWIEESMYEKSSICHL